MIRAVIFDLGGTLTEPAGRPTGVEPDTQNAAALQTWLAERGFDAGDRFVPDLVAERQACFARRQGGLQEVTAAEAEDAFFEPELAAMQLLPGAEETLRRLQALKLRLGLASNASSHYFVTECCRRLGLAGHLDPIVSSAAVGWAKPSPRIFARLLDAWSVVPQDVVMVGDTPAADIAGARALGMAAILLARADAPMNHSLRSDSGQAAGDDAAHPPDARVASLVEVAELIERWLYQLR